MHIFIYFEKNFITSILVHLRNNVLKIFTPNKRWKNLLFASGGGTSLSRTSEWA